MSFAKPEKKDDHVNEDDKLYCSHPGCRNVWAVRMDGQMPKCSYHQWQQPQYGNTKTYQQFMADKNKPPVVKNVGAWYEKEQW